MTDKKLLLIDLSARLPYNTTKVRWYKYKRDPEGYVDTVLNQLLLDTDKGEVYCKPYLRPMSSMTEEEKKEFGKLINLVEERCINAYGKGGYTLAFTELNDWLNKHHFDYRGLIEKGLALVAPEGMYK